MLKMSMLRGHSLAEMLMVITIISVVTSVAMPMMTVRKVGDYDFNTIRCLRQELAANLNSPACSAAIRDGLNGMNQSMKTLITTSDTQGRATNLNDGKGGSITTDAGSGTPIKTAALKVLREICDRGGDEACRFFVNDCKKNVFACDRTDAAVTDYDLNFYLNLQANNVANIGRMKVVQIASNYYLNGLSFPNGAFANILNIVERECSESATSDITACEIIRNNAKKQVYDFTTFERFDFTQEDGDDGTMFKNGNLMISDRSPLYSFSGVTAIESFNINSVPYVVVGGANSILYKWNSTVGRFSPYQELGAINGLKYIKVLNNDYLYFTKAGGFYSYKWNGRKFLNHTNTISDASPVAKIESFEDGGNIYLVTSNTSGTDFKINVSQIYPTFSPYLMPALSAVSTNPSYSLLNSPAGYNLIQANTTSSGGTYNVYNWDGTQFQYVNSQTSFYNQSLNSFVEGTNRYITEAQYIPGNSITTLNTYVWDGANSSILQQLQRYLSSMISIYSGSELFTLGSDKYLVDAVVSNTNNSFLFLQKWNGTGFSTVSTNQNAFPAYNKIKVVSAGGNQYLVSPVTSPAGSYVKFARWNGTNFAKVKPFYFVTTTDNNRVSGSRVLLINGVQNAPAGSNINWYASFDKRVTWQYYNGTAWVNTSLSNTATTVGSTYGQIEAGLKNKAMTTFDIGFSLQTTDINNNPSIQKVEIFYR